MTQDLGKLNKWVSEQIEKARAQVHKEYEPLVKNFNLLRDQRDLAVAELKRLERTDIGAQVTLQRINSIAQAAEQEK